MASAGKRNLITDVPGVLVGNAEDPKARTGVTVLRFPERAVAGVAVAGGGPGTRETDLLRADTLVDCVDAVVLAGGSVYGLAAADGVAAALGAQGEGFRLFPGSPAPASPIVPGAILYDLANGGDKAWGDQPPYAELGKAALTQAAETFTLGRAGAGFGAQAGAVPGGLGSASVKTEDGLSVGAVAAVNSAGSVRHPGTRAFWSWPFELDGEFGGARPWDDGPPAPLDPEAWGEAKGAPQPRANTTIGLVAVSAPLSPGQAGRLAHMAAAGLARAIRPVFTPFDGDVVFAAGTGRGEAADFFTLSRLGALAADCLARAVARGVWEAERA